MFRLLLLLMLAALSGCATYGQDKYFETDRTLDAAAKAATIDSEFASVYLIRPKQFGQAIVLTPVPPLYYAVNGRLVSIMPLGTYVHLKLPPGPHTFSLLRYRPADILLGPKIVQNDVAVALEGGRKYYIAESLSFLSGGSFKRLQERDGVETLADAQLAKLLYAPATVEAFKRRLLERPKDQQPSVASSLLAALPSQKQVSDFFEGLATVAVVALFVVGTLLGADKQGSPPERPLSLEPPPAYYQQQAPGRWSIRTSAGVATEVSTADGETRLRNWTTGVTYTIAGNRISGSDGSRYRVIGSSIISDTGEHLQRVGSAIFGSDGRSCDVIGSQILCRPPR